MSPSHTKEHTHEQSVCPVHDEQSRSVLDPMPLRGVADIPALARPRPRCSWTAAVLTN